MHKSIDETITALKVIRTALCVYKSPNGKMCDCKFGVHHLPNQKLPQLPRSESGCGCPELYEAIAYLEELKKIKERMRD